MTRDSRKEKRVTWDAVTADQVKDYHNYSHRSCRGVEKAQKAQVAVEGIIAVEEVSTTTPVGKKPALPESVRTITLMVRPLCTKSGMGCGRSATLGQRRRSCPLWSCRRNHDLQRVFIFVFLAPQSRGQHEAMDRM